MVANRCHACRQAASLFLRWLPRSISEGTGHCGTECLVTRRAKLADPTAAECFILTRCMPWAARDHAHVGRTPRTMVAYPDPQAGLKARTVVNTWIESLLRYCASTRAVTAGISLLGLAWLGALISPAAAQTAEEEIAAAARPFGGFKQSYGGSDDGGSRLFQDTVDPFTGTLQAHIKPIEVPGNGGLNISVGLAYRMEGLRNTGSSRLSASSSAMFEDTPWSPGAWLLAVAPKVVFRADGTTNPTGVYKPVHTAARCASWRTLWLCENLPGIGGRTPGTPVPNSRRAVRNSDPLAPHLRWDHPCAYEPRRAGLHIGR